MSRKDSTLAQKISCDKWIKVGNGIYLSSARLDLDSKGRVDFNELQQHDALVVKLDRYAKPRYIAKYPSVVHTGRVSKTSKCAYSKKIIDKVLKDSISPVVTVTMGGQPIVDVVDAKSEEIFTVDIESSTSYASAYTHAIIGRYYSKSEWRRVELNIDLRRPHSGTEITIKRDYAPDKRSNIYHHRQATASVLA